MKHILLAATALSLAGCATTSVEAAGKPLTIYFNPLTVVVTEGQGATFTLNKSGGNGKPQPVEITTSDNSYHTSIMPGTSFTVPTVDDSIVNGTRTITVTGTATTGAKATATITVNDNDTAPPPPATQTCPDGSVIPADQTCPAPPPPPVASEPVPTPNGLSGEFDIADNFDVSTTITPTIETVPASADPIAAFRFTCLSGQLLYDDPIVYPGQPGKSHLHQFFGNTLTNANSNYNSLRTTGNSSCTVSGLPATPQRSAYWEPAMLDGAGNVVKPNYFLTYYKNFPSGNADCQGPPDATHFGWCIEIPNGLRFIVGYNAATGTGNPTDPNDRMYWGVAFECLTPDQQTSLSGVQHSIADVVATGKCAVGDLLRTAIGPPNCWDGKYLDTEDHRAHMAFANGAILENFAPACPVDHPYMIPSLAFQAFYTIDSNFLAGLWHYSSDEMLPGFVVGPNSPVKAGTSFHADYWEAWSPIIKKDWQTGCIDKHLSCNVGEMGNGFSIIGMVQTHGNHELVPVPPKPAM